MAKDNAAGTPTATSENTPEKPFTAYLDACKLVKAAKSKYAASVVKQNELAAEVAKDFQALAMANTAKATALADIERANA